MYHNTMFYLNRIPSGFTQVVDLKDEVVLYSLKPLDSNTVICHPSNSGQVVLTEGKKEKQLTLFSFSLRV